MHQKLNKQTFRIFFRNPGNSGKCRKIISIEPEIPENFRKHSDLTFMYKTKLKLTEKHNTITKYDSKEAQFLD